MQRMGIAQAMFAGQIAVRIPTVVDPRTEVCDENPEVLEGFPAPLGMTAHPCQCRGGQDMHPVPRPCPTGAGRRRSGTEGHAELIKIGQVIHALTYRLSAYVRESEKG